MQTNGGGRVVYGVFLLGLVTLVGVRTSWHLRRDAGTAEVSPSTEGSSRGLASESPAERPADDWTESNRGRPADVAEASLQAELGHLRTQLLPPSDEASRMLAAKRIAELGPQAALLTGLLLRRLLQDDGLVSGDDIADALIAVGSGQAPAIVAALLAELREQLFNASAPNSNYVGQASRVIDALDPGNRDLVANLVRKAIDPQLDQRLGIERFRVLLALGNLRERGQAAAPALTDLLRRLPKDDYASDDTARTLLNIDPSNEVGLAYVMKQFHSPDPSLRERAIFSFRMIDHRIPGVVPLLLEGMAGNITISDNSIYYAGVAILRMEENNRRVLDYARKRLDTGTRSARVSSCMLFDHFFLQHFEEAETDWAAELNRCKVEFPTLREEAFLWM